MQDPVRDHSPRPAGSAQVDRAIPAGLTISGAVFIVIGVLLLLGTVEDFELFGVIAVVIGISDLGVAIFLRRRAERAA